MDSSKHGNLGNNGHNRWNTLMHMLEEKEDMKCYKILKLYQKGSVSIICNFIALQQCQKFSNFLSSAVYIFFGTLTRRRHILKTVKIVTI